jgi:flagellar L-ring protein FlgH
MKRLVVISVALAAAAAAGCAGHIAPYHAKHRKIDAGAYPERPRATGASLYALGNRGLFEDDKAGQVGDVLIIRIDEADSASHDATTKLNRKNSDKKGLPGSFGILNAIAAANPNIDPANLFDAETDSQFAGAGNTKRTGRLNATLPVRVREILGNGDLFVEGSKVIMVGEEEHQLYVSGIVRPADIQPDNSVLSSRVADAEIEYTGRGDVSDQQRAGWLSRILGKIWPF